MNSFSYINTPFSVLRYSFDFALARTALKQGLSLLGAQQFSTIAVPDFICDVVLHPIQELNLQIIYYPLHDDLTPVWSELNRIQANEPLYALMMVHYFGIPQDIDKFIAFCVSNDIYLIEDAAHCAGGEFSGRPLGTFGDIGITSSRKMLNQQYGGHLYVNFAITNFPYEFIQPLPKPTLSLSDTLKFLFSRSQYLMSFFRSLSFSYLDWSNPVFFKESIKPHYSLPLWSRLYFQNTSWPTVSSKRRANWHYWNHFFQEFDIQCPFSSLSEQLCPWAFPIYARNIHQRNLILDWGILNSIPLFTWPVLPSQFISPSHPAFLRWQRLVCVPLDFSYSIRTPLQLSR